MLDDTSLDSSRTAGGKGKSDLAGWRGRPDNQFEVSQLVAVGTGLNFTFLWFILTQESVFLVEDRCLHLAKGQALVTVGYWPLLDKWQGEAVNIINCNVNHVC